MIELVVVGVVTFVIGYVARRYVEKKWPNEAALMDAVATRYGKAAEDRLRSFKDNP